MPVGVFLENNFGCSMLICSQGNAGDICTHCFSLALMTSVCVCFAYSFWDVTGLHSKWDVWCLSTHDKTVRQGFQNENKMSKNSGEFISCKINQIWTFSEPKRYKTGPINKTQLFRVFIHNKMFSYITTAKRKPHNFFIAIILNKVCHFFLSLIFGTKIELYLKWSSKTHLAFLFSNGSFKSIQL